jgi:predicted nuclease of predicted toxin-antitoxin system
VKLLFDQNISHRVVLRLLADYPEAKHVRDFNMQFSTDMEIWNFAKQNEFTLITFDSDFNDFVVLKGHPPKVIWLRFGNTLTHNLVEKIIDFKPIITAFLTDKTYEEVGCLEIDD